MCVHATTTAGGRHSRQVLQAAQNPTLAFNNIDSPESQIYKLTELVYVFEVLTQPWKFGVCLYMRFANAVMALPGGDVATALAAIGIKYPLEWPNSTRRSSRGSRFEDRLSRPVISCQPCDRCRRKKTRTLLLPADQALAHSRRFISGLVAGLVTGRLL